MWKKILWFFYLKQGTLKECPAINKQTIITLFPNSINGPLTTTTQPSERLNLATLSKDKKTLKAFLNIWETVPSFNSTVIFCDMALSPR